MWAELFDYWNRSATPVQAWSQVAVYALIGGLGVFGGWYVRGLRR